MPRESCYVLKKPVCGTDFTSRHWLSLDNCGITCGVLTQLLHVYVFFVVQSRLLSSDMWVTSYDVSTSKPVVDDSDRNAARVISCILTGLAMTSHLRAMFSDPGAVPEDARPLSGNSGKNRCTKCKEGRGIFKPPRAHHDSITGRCVVKMDHFCPWVNNVVGIKNHKFFLLFVLYTALAGLFTFGLLARCSIYCSLEQYDHSHNSSDDAPDSPDPSAPHSSNSTAVPKPSGCSDFYSPNIGLSFFTCLIFTCFTMCMLFDQSEAVTTGVTKIERLKKERAAAMPLSLASSDPSFASLEAKTVYDFNEIFGGHSRHFRPHWLLPTAVHFDPNVIDEVMGYRVSNGDDSDENDDIESGGGSARLHPTTTDDVPGTGLQLREVQVVVGAAQSPRQEAVAVGAEETSSSSANDGDDAVVDEMEKLLMQR